MDAKLQELVDKRLAEGEFIVVSVGQPSLKDQKGIAEDLTMVNLEMEAFGHTLISRPVLDNHDPTQVCGDVLGIFFSDDHHLMCVSALHGKTQSSKDLISKIRQGKYKECSMGSEYSYDEYIGIPYKDGIFLTEMSFCEAGAIDGTTIVATTASKKAGPGTTDPHGTRIIKAMEVDMMTKDGKHLRKSGKFVGAWHIANQLSIRKEEMATNESSSVDYKALYEKEAAERKAAETARDAAHKVLAEEKHAQRLKLVQENAVPRLAAAKKALEAKGMTDTSFYVKYAALDEKALVEKLENNEAKFAKFMENVDTITAMASAEMDVEEASGVEKSESAVPPEGALASKQPMDKAQDAHRQVRNEAKEATKRQLKAELLAELKAEKDAKRSEKLSKKAEVDKLLDESMKGASKVKPYDWTDKSSKKRPSEERVMDSGKKAKTDNLPSAAAASKDPQTGDEFRTKSIFTLAHVVHHARHNTGAQLPTSAVASRSTPKKEDEFDVECLKKGPKFDKAIADEVKRLNGYHTGAPVSNRLSISETDAHARTQGMFMREQTLALHPFQIVSSPEYLQRVQ
jgi:hypothetical protein